MTEALVLKAQKREKTGTAASRKARKEGLIPATIYGHQTEVVSVLLSYHDLMMEIQHHHRMVTVELAGKKETCLIKDAQFDYLGDTIIHIDLTRVDMNERVAVTVELAFRGEPAGASEGGILDLVMTEIELECMVSAIPENIRVQLEGLGIGDHLNAGDIELPDGIKLLTDPAALIAACKVIVEEEEVEGEEGGDEPEVIARDKEDESAE
ncbi:MAG: 50S ribosomal protein L25 [Phycisphaerae bacterium]|nr:50S ribosomal protein L25 [Phycisphaerae bacterium]